MDFHGTVTWDEDEVDVLVRAMQGLGNLIIDPPRTMKEEQSRPVARHLRRIDEHGEAYNIEALLDLDDTLQRMVAELEPQTAASWWRERGAPGEEDAVEGLALQRREQVRRIAEARVVVALAKDLIERLEGVAERIGREGVAAAMAG